MAQLTTLKSFLMGASSNKNTGSYHFDHWQVHLGKVPTDDDAQMASLHEMYHGQLNDTTAYGTLLHIVSTMCQMHQNEESYNDLLESLIDCSTTTHEVFATYSSMFVVHRGLPQQALIEPYGKNYIRYFQTANHFAKTLSNPLLGYQLLHSIIRACMQINCLDLFSVSSPSTWSINLLTEKDKPDVRLSCFEHSDFLPYIKKGLKDLICKEKDQKCLNALTTKVWSRETYRRFIVDDTADAVYDKVGFMLYELCVAYLKVVSIPCLSFNGHQKYVDDLISNAENTFPKDQRGKLASPSTPFLPEKENLLHDFANEKLLISNEKYPAQIHLLDCATIERVEDFFSKDNPHIHLTIRPVEQLRAQYSFHQEVNFDSDVKIFIAMRVRMQSDRGYFYSVEHFYIASVDILVQLIKKVQQTGFVYISCSYSCLLDSQWQKQWMPALRQADFFSVVINQNPFELLEHWIKTLNLRFKYSTISLQYMDYTYVVFTLYPLDDQDVIYFFLCSEIVAKALTTELSQYKEMAIGTAEHLKKNMPIRAVLSHLIREEPWFSLKV